MLEIGSMVDGKYKILSEIGHGGMSTVYLAINEKANKPWAIKEVRKDGVQDFEVVKQSIIVETDMLKKLSHKGLPSIVDVIDAEDNFLIVMDYIEGNTLKDVLQEQGAQPQEKVVDWAKQLCEVLIYLHSRKPPIIYRDMKPSNIMLRSDGSVVLIDFGTAREFKERNTSDTVCLGTQGYAAPEQFGGQGQTDARTDIYSLGATIYHLVTGHNPSEPPYEMYPITQWNATLSTGLEKIILKCTQRNPQDRYQTAEELLYDLEHYRDYDVTAMKRYRKRLRVFIFTMLLGIICLVASFAIKKTVSQELGNTYEYLISVADKAATSEDALDYYQQAIQVDSTKDTAYSKMIEIFMEDGVFSDEEEEILVKLNISVEQYFMNFSKSNPEGYADFCYDVGTLYWFYYTHEENKQSNAVKWFQTALEYYEDEPTKEKEYKRCRLYVELGTFYKKVLQAQIEGNDDGMYQEYWDNMLELLDEYEENPDREIITLKLYREIANRITEYAKYFLEEGVTRIEMEDVLTLMSDSMNVMEQDGTNQVKNEIAEIRILIENAEDMLISSDRGGSE